MTAFHPRRLRPDERALLESAIATTGTAAAPWREQAARVEVRGVCDCGCGTIELGYPGKDRDMGEKGPEVLAEGTYEEDGASFLILLFAHEGSLRTLEIVPLTDDPPARFPAAGMVTWAPRSTA